MTLADHVGAQAQAEPDIIVQPSARDLPGSPKVEADAQVGSRDQSGDLPGRVDDTMDIARSPKPAEATLPAGGTRDWPGNLAMLWAQVRHQNRLFLRSPLMALFTLVLPVSLLALLRVIYTDDIAVRFDANGVVTFAQFYVPSLAAFTAAQATYSSLAVNLATQRDRGVLKRIRVTPLPAWVYMTGAVVSAMFIALLGAAIMVIAGSVFYDLDIDPGQLLPTLASFALGVATFAALGMALASIIPGGSAAHAVANATLLPIAFISDVFIPLYRPPQWLDTLGDVLPLKPFSESLQLGFATRAPQVGTLSNSVPSIELSKWAVMFAWLLLGLAAARWRFRWNERTGS